MVTKQRKKNSRQRAGTTHGWGSMKKNRGAGNRGGKGNAGSGKRGDAKKPSYWKDKKKFGMHGFKKKGRVQKHITLNVSDVAALATKHGKTTLNLTELGFTKLLGSGKVTKAYTLTIDHASARAIEKINGAKGTVTTLSGGADTDAADAAE